MNGATFHYAAIVKAYLDRGYNDRWIGWRGCCMAPSISWFDFIQFLFMRVS